MIKDQIQAEADKAAKAIHEALAGFHRATGLEVKAEAGWESAQQYSKDGRGTFTIKRELRAVVEVVCGASSASGAHTVASPKPESLIPLGMSSEWAAGDDQMWRRCQPPSVP